jgi:hypothetical protein
MRASNEIAEARPGNYSLARCSGLHSLDVQKTFYSSSGASCRPSREKRLRIGKDLFAIDAPTSAASIQSEAKPPETELAVLEARDEENE